MSDTSPVAEATPETTAALSLPYNDAVPGSVLARWAEETDPALIVAADKIIDLLTYLRDEEKYDFLSSVTCVDYLTYKGKLRKGISERFDVVYHLYSTSKGGGHIVLHAPVAKNDTIASATGIFPGANLQEREIYDLYGIKFTGHPNLRRILLWEGFNGHPMLRIGKRPISKRTKNPSRVAPLRAIMSTRKTSCPGPRTPPTLPVGIPIPGKSRSRTCPSARPPSMPAAPIWTPRAL